MKAKPSILSFLFPAAATGAFLDAAFRPVSGPARAVDILLAVGFAALAVQRAKET